MKKPAFTYSESIGIIKAFKPIRFQFGGNEWYSEYDFFTNIYPGSTFSNPKYVVTESSTGLKFKGTWATRKQAKAECLEELKAVSKSIFVEAVKKHRVSKSKLRKAGLL